MNHLKNPTEGSKLAVKLKSIVSASRVYRTSSCGIGREHLIQVRRKILEGIYDSEVSSTTPSDWGAPLWKIPVFVSSTSSDCEHERSALMYDVLPYLNELFGCVQIMFVDLNWGKRCETTPDSGFWIECSRELERCREESAGIFFLSLQGDK